MKTPNLLILIFLTAFLGCTGKQTTPTIDLSGEWSFRIDSLDKGIDEKWFNNSFEETIRLPGSMAENGKGDDITVNTHWTGKIVDKSWYSDEKYARYRKAGNIKIPFWLQPVKKYTGAAWYRKEIEIPKNREAKK